MDDRVAARLANDQVGPLHHHDGHEESGVARELEGLAVAVRLWVAKQLWLDMVAISRILETGLKSRILEP